MCVKCGFSDERALQIDHVNGNGRADRGSLSPDQFYARVSQILDQYQLLCANCNTIKKVENDESAIKW